MSNSADLSKLSASVGAARTDPKQWSPPFCGDIDMEIRRDGQWFYGGTPIQRLALVKLFARVLRKEGDEYFLITPVEKVRIRVEDAPFLVVDADVIQTPEQGQQVTLRTSLGDELALDDAHPLRVLGEAEQRRPYVLVREDLWALLARPVYYRLAEYVQAIPDELVNGEPLERDRDHYGIKSCGQWFHLD